MRRPHAADLVVPAKQAGPACMANREALAGLADLAHRHLVAAAGMTGLAAIATITDMAAIMGMAGITTGGSEL